MLKVVFNPTTGKLDFVSKESPAGSNTYIQFNDSGVFGGDSGLTYNKTTDQLGINNAQFSLTPTTTPTGAGQVAWNSTDGTLDLGLSTDVTMQIGQELPILVYNDTGVIIPNGSPVYIAGRHGHLPKVALAQSNSETTADVIGLATQDIPATGAKTGYVTTFGYVRGIKTNYTGTGDWGTTWAENDNLYISKTVAGQLTNIQPSTPHHSDVVGKVAIVGSLGTGSIQVNIIYHKTVEELSDVDGTPINTTGQFLVWNQTNGYWDANYNITNYTTQTDFDAHVNDLANPHDTSDSNLITSDITTNNATTLKHGFLPRLSGSATQYLNGTGNYVTISGTGVPSGYGSASFTGQTSVAVLHNFGIKPLVQVLDSAGSPLVQVPLNITHDSDNQFTVTFSTSQSGTILYSVGSPSIPNVTTTAIDYTIVANDNIVIVTAFNKTITLPTAVGITGKTYTIDNNSTGNIFLTGTGGQTIQSVATQSIPSQSSIVVYSTGSNWRIT